MTNALFHGIIPPVLTPLLDGDTLDRQGLDNVLERLLTGGVQGLFLLGTTGEGPSLSYRLRRELVTHALKSIGSRVPVMIGITDTSIEESLRMADFAAENGAQAVVLAPPYYHPISQNDLFAYLEKIAERLPLPAFLYNMPSHCKTWYEIDTLRRVFDIPKYIGLKDSSDDMDYFKKAAELIVPQERLTLLVGPEDKLPYALSLGAHGGISGGAHLLPRLFVRIVECYRAKDAAGSAKYQKRLTELGGIYPVGGGFLKTIKAAMEILGVCKNVFAEPIQAISAEQAEKVRQALEKAGIDRSTLE